MSVDPRSVLYVAPVFPFGDPDLMLELVSYASSWAVVVGILLFHGRPILMPHSQRLQHAR